MRALVNSLHHEGLLVRINYNTGGYNYDLPLNFSWGDESGIEVPSSSDFIEVTRNAAGENISNNRPGFAQVTARRHTKQEGFSFRNIYGYKIG
ncbi:MAG: hypothetical protein R2744_10945 [Bacteroidales bacterium]